MDQPLAMKKSRRAKKTSTKTQKARKLELRKGLQAPRTDVPPLKEVSHAEFQAAKREEKKNLKRAAKVKKVGEKKPYLQEGDNCPTLAEIRGNATKSQRGATSPIRSVPVLPGHQEVTGRGFSFVAVVVLKKAILRKSSTVCCKASYRSYGCRYL